MDPQILEILILSAFITIKKHRRKREKSNVSDCFLIPHIFSHRSWSLGNCTISESYVKDRKTGRKVDSKKQAKKTETDGTTYDTIIRGELREPLADSEPLEIVRIWKAPSWARGAKHPSDFTTNQVF